MTMFVFGLGFFAGLAVLGGVWALLTNVRNHPGKVEEQVSALERKL